MMAVNLHIKYAGPWVLRRQGRWAPRATVPQGSKVPKGKFTQGPMGPQGPPWYPRGAYSGMPWQPPLKSWKSVFKMP